MPERKKKEEKKENVFERQKKKKLSVSDIRHLEWFIKTLNLQWFKLQNDWYY